MKYNTGPAPRCYHRFAVACLDSTDSAQWVMNVTACATLGYAAFDLETALRQISRRGYAKVEITELGSYCRHLPYPEASPDRVQSQLERHRLRPVAMNVSLSRLVDGEIFRPSMAVDDQAADIEKRLRWYLDLAAELSIPLVSAPMAPRILDEAVWEPAAMAACSVMGRLCEYATKRGVGLNIEVPHLFLIADTADHALWILDRLGDVPQTVPFFDDDPGAIEFNHF